MKAYFLRNIRGKVEVQWNLFSFYAIIVKSSKMGQPKSTKETVYGDQKVNVAAC